MSVCIYDNPKTMARECWRNGKLIHAYQFELLLYKSPIPPNQFFFGANIGEWKPGRIVGDVKAVI